MQDKNKLEDYSIVRIPDSEVKLKHEILEIEDIYKQTDFTVKSQFENITYNYEQDYYIRMIKKGRGIFNINEESVHINSGDLLLINPSQPHSIIMDYSDDIAVMTLWVDELLLNRFLTVLKEKDKHFTENPDLVKSYEFKFSKFHYKNMHNIERLMTQYFHSEDFNIASEFIRELTLQEILYYIMNEEFKTYLDIKDKTAVSPALKGELIKRIEIAKDFICENFNNKISVKQLSIITGLSSSYFMYLFKEYTRITPYQYLINVRMDKAKDLLKNSNKPAKEIAEILGYPTFSSFAKAFKLYTGLTPSEYRS